MNVWKPIAIVATAGLVAVVGAQTAYANKPAEPEPAKLSGPCWDQPQMAAAKANLEAAYSHLLHSEHNKGGWRDAAIAATQTAIARTNEGCRVANH